MEDDGKTTRHVYLVYSVGLPGIGKSYLFGKLKDYCLTLPDNAIRICVADVSRSKVLDEHYASHHINIDELSQEAIYKIEALNGPQIKAELNRDVFAKMKELRDSQAVHNIFVIDKNHSPQSLIDTIEEAVNHNFGNPVIHRCILIPESFGSVEGEELYYPFNFNILLISLIRSLWRKDHLTMKFGPVHSLLSFIGSIKAQIKDSFEERYPKDKYSYIPIHYYNIEVIEEGLKDPENMKKFTELHKIIDELIQGKKEVPESTEQVVNLVKPLKPLNSFAKIDEDYVKEVYEKILASI